MSDDTFLQQIAAATSLDEIQNLRQERPWGESPMSEVYDFALEQRADALEQRADALEQRALKDGTFYARIHEVFPGGGTSIPPATDEAFYISCCRPKPQTEAEASSERQELDRLRQKNERDNRQQRRQEPSNLSTQNMAQRQPRPQNTAFACRTGAASKPIIDAYKVTFKAATSKQNSPATENGQSRNSTHAGKRFEIWKKAAVGSAPAGDIAHLVPASPTKAESYWFVTELLFGIDKNRDYMEISRLINGSNVGRKKDKIASTGIKHMVTNKVLLASQRDYYDAAPCVIIVPILSREDAIGWSGGGYKAIMLIDDFEGVQNTLESVCNLTFFTHKSDETAEPGDLTLANILLQDYTRAILYAQGNRKPEEVNFTPNEATAFYPNLSSRSHPPVRKISFQDNISAEGHPAPDPLLLVTKAISVLQRRNDYLIVAAAEPTDASHAQSDRSIQAEEEYLAHREASQLYRDPVGMDIVMSH